MSAPNITVKFLEPEELNDFLRKSDIKTKTSEPSDDSKPETEEVPEIVQESVNTPSPPAASPAEASPTAVSLKAEGPYKDNIAHEDNIPSAVGIDSIPKPKEDHCRYSDTNKAPARQVEQKKLLGRALDHSRRAQAERGDRGVESGAPGHGNNNKIGIGLMVAGIVGLLLTGRS